MFDADNSINMFEPRQEDFDLQASDVSQIEPEGDPEPSEDSLLIVQDIEDSTISFMDAIEKGLSEINVNLRGDDISASFAASEAISQNTSRLPEAKHGQFVAMKQFEKLNKENSSLK
jgi:hypothetical protein